MKSLENCYLCDFGSLAAIASSTQSDHLKKGDGWNNKWKQEIRVAGYSLKELSNKIINLLIILFCLLSSLLVICVFYTEWN